MFIVSADLVRRLRRSTVSTFGRRGPFAAGSISPGGNGDRGGGGVLERDAGSARVPIDAAADDVRVRNSTTNLRLAKVLQQVTGFDIGTDRRRRRRWRRREDIDELGRLRFVEVLPDVGDGADDADDCSGRVGGASENAVRYLVFGHCACANGNDFYGNLLG